MTYYGEIWRWGWKNQIIVLLRPQMHVPPFGSRTAITRVTLTGVFTASSLDFPGNFCCWLWSNKNKKTFRSENMVRMRFTDFVVPECIESQLKCIAGWSYDAQSLSVEFRSFWFGQLKNSRSKVQQYFFLPINFTLMHIFRQLWKKYVSPYWM